MTMITPDSPLPCILHIDLDYFYAQVEQVRNPSANLISKPLGIQQKQIIVTCNYIARERGVKKLQLLTDALKACPDLVVIDGSDLSEYRRVSRKIYQFVIWFVGRDFNSTFDSQCQKDGNLKLDQFFASQGATENSSKKLKSQEIPIQRIGMDEVIVDVTELVYNHVTNPSNEVWPDGTKSFSFPPRTSKFPSDPSRVLIPPSFLYYPLQFSSSSLPYEKPKTSIIGSVDPGTTLLSPEKPYLGTLYLASEMASALRKAIFDEFGLTCSAGISHSRLYAKLAASHVKPNGQTIWIDSLKADQHFIEMGVRCIPGFGSKMVKQMRSFLEGRREEHEPVNTYEEYGTFSFDSYEDDPVHQVITVKEARSLSEEDLVSLYGEEMGQKVLQWVHGYDDTPVIDTKPPLQISVEDSFRSCKEMVDLKSRLAQLMHHLIERLEEEEMEDGKWKRQPKQIRLTVRFVGGDYGKRVSRSKPVNTIMLDTTLTYEERTTKALDPVLIPLFKNIVKETLGENGESRFNINLLNVCFSDFVPAKKAYSSTSVIDALKRKDSERSTGRIMVGILPDNDVTDSSRSSKRQRTSSPVQVQMAKKAARSHHQNSQRSLNHFWKTS